MPMMEGAATHQPWLSLAVMKTDGKIAEFGMGWYSTPLLHYLAQAGGRELMSYETDIEWYSKFDDFGHDKIMVIDYATQPFEGDGPFDVALVDSSPGDYRIEIVKRLKGICKFILAHDTEADIPPSAGAYGWSKLDGLFKYQTVLKTLRPWTTVYSDVEEFTL